MIATAITIIFVYFTALFIAGTAQRNNSIVDVGWGPVSFSSPGFCC